MTRPRRDDPNAGAERSAAERERARLEREARRSGTTQPPPASSPPPDLAASASSAAAPEHAEPEPPYAQAIPRHESPAHSRGADGVLRIQPKPPAPPAAPAGALDDETERPIGIRRVRRPARPIVTPPGDTPAGPARRRRSGTNRLVGLLAFAALAIVVIGSLMLFQPFGSAEGARVRIDIPTGSSAGDIGKQLAQAGIVDSAFLFNVRATLAGKRDSLRSGAHTLNKDMTYGKAIAALTAQPEITKPATVTVTIPEGRSRREIVAIAKQAGLKGSYLDASERFAGSAEPVSLRRPEGHALARGLPLPGDLRARGRRARARSRRAPAGGVRGELRGRRPDACEAQEPDRLRRADHRLDGRARGAARARAPADRGGHLQPPQGPHAARHRRDDALRAQQAQRRAEAVRAGDRLGVQHAQAQRPAADADRQPRAVVDPRRRCPGERPLPLLRRQARAPAASMSSRRRSSSTTATSRATAPRGHRPATSRRRRVERRRSRATACSAGRSATAARRR